jgi:hypothetical protein
MDGGEGLEYLTQESFVRALCILQFPNESIKSWLLTVAHNLYVDYVKKIEDWILGISVSAVTNLIYRARKTLRTLRRNIKFQEKLQLYKDGKLSQNEVAEIEGELDKFTAMMDYLNDDDKALLEELTQQIPEVNGRISLVRCG